MTTLHWNLTKVFGFQVIGNPDYLRGDFHGASAKQWTLECANVFDSILLAAVDLLEGRPLYWSLEFMAFTTNSHVLLHPSDHLHLQSFHLLTIRNTLETHLVHCINESSLSNIIFWNHYHWCQEHFRINKAGRENKNNRTTFYKKFFIFQKKVHNHYYLIKFKSLCVWRLQYNCLFRGNSAFRSFNLSCFVLNSTRLERICTFMNYSDRG